MKCKLEEIVEVTMGQSPKSEYDKTASARVSCQQDR